MIVENENEAKNEKQLLERENNYLKQTMEQRTQRVENELDLVKKEWDTLVLKLASVKFEDPSW